MVPVARHEIAVRPGNADVRPVALHLLDAEPESKIERGHDGVVWSVEPAAGAQAWRLVRLAFVHIPSDGLGRLTLLAA